MTRIELPQTIDIKLMIIENFIDHYTSDESLREEMYGEAWKYIKGDHVDEINQAFKILNK
jgi:hypothetical protein